MVLAVPPLVVLVLLASVLAEDKCSSRNFSRRCTYCRSGWYGNDCELKCIGHCDSGGCDRKIGLCFLCENNYYGLNCPENCSGSKCERVTGNCNFCEDNWWGIHCHKQCPEQCGYGNCSQWFGTCSLCKIGWWGETCTEPCSDYCRQNLCRSIDGFCTHGCEQGSTGATCNNNCSEGCQDNLCSQLEGVCNTRCRNGLYGSHCNMTCDANCDLCDQMTGQCDICSDGFCQNAYNGDADTKCIQTMPPTTSGTTIPTWLFILANVLFPLLIMIIVCQCVQCDERIIKCKVPNNTNRGNQDD